MMLRIAVVLSVTGLVGCSATIVPPADPVEPVVVAVVDYGRHTSLVLPQESGAGGVEYAFGDWNWCAQNRNTFGDGVSALLASKQATLGRMALPDTPGSPQLVEMLEPYRILSFPCSAPLVNSLRDKLDQQFEARADQMIYNPAMRMYFVPHDEQYRLWHNCNHVTARWLRELGCEVRGVTMTSNFKLTEPR